MMNYLHISFLFMIGKRFHIVIIATLRKMSILVAMLEHKKRFYDKCYGKMQTAVLQSKP